jgi:hypothetical protein
VLYITHRQHDNFKSLGHSSRRSIKCQRNPCRVSNHENLHQTRETRTYRKFVIARRRSEPRLDRRQLDECVRPIYGIGHARESQIIDGNSRSVWETRAASNRRFLQKLGEKISPRRLRPRHVRQKQLGKIDNCSVRRRIAKIKPRPRLSNCNLPSADQMPHKAIIYFPLRLYLINSPFSSRHACY